MGAMETQREVRLLVDGGSFFECPRWHEGRWWVSDFHRHSVFAIGQDGQQQVAMTVDAQPAGLGWLPDGSLLVASMKDHRLLRKWPDDSITEHADLTGLCRGYLNDMIVDAEGRAYVGNFGYAVAAGESRAPCPLVCVDVDGTASIVGEDLLFPNGTVITADGRTLIVAETMGCRLSAFTIQPDGSLTDRRIWAQLAPTPAPDAEVPIGPDGCCLDAEGQIWVADAFGRRCRRIGEGGAISEEITIPGQGIYACMLGGSDGRTLLMCVAPNFGEANRRDVRDASLFTTQVDVPRAGLP
jgi:sugar lactone lactonase YvrE